MAKRRFKRVMATGDWHCGHQVGLSTPAYHTPTTSDHKFLKLANVRRDVWNWFDKKLTPWKPIDILILNGDALDGKGDRSGGTEQITPDRKVQCDMGMAVIEFIDPSIVRMLYGCLTAGHKILTSDLRYIPVEQLKKGDRLLAFDDKPDEKTRRRYYREAEVLSNDKALSPSCYRLDLSDGTSITATHDHRFLMKYGNSSGYVWQSVKDLYNRSIYKYNKNAPYLEGTHTAYMPIKFKRFLSVWEQDQSYSGGYLAGFFDGEGSLSQRRKGRFRNNGNEESVFALNATQVQNTAMRTAIDYLQELNFKYSIYNKGDRGANQQCFEIKLTGGTVDCLRFLGTVRPKRLLEKLDINKMGSLRNPCNDDTEIINITPVGEQVVYALGTSTGTYISEGYLSHNTPYHTGSGEDWEDILAEKAGAKIGSHEWFDINGKIFDCKHKLGSSQIPHGRLTPLAREILWNKEWSFQHNTPLADVLIRSHVHYYEQVDHDNCLGFSLPAMQGFGSKFGARQCSGKVDIGFVIFDVQEDGKITWKTEKAEIAVLKAKAEKL